MKADPHERSYAEEPTLAQAGTGPGASASGSGPMVSDSDTQMAASTMPVQPASAKARVPRGSPIGRYVVLDELGAGGMGVVYAAYDPELDRKIAVKVLQPSFVAGTDATGGSARLVREAQAMARLSHPNVVHVHDVGVVGETVFVAMEFVEGSTMSRWLERGPRSQAEVLEIFAQAGRGLAAAHAAGLVHRDFKPDNVLIGTDARVRVLDFGLAHGRGDPPEPSDSSGSHVATSQLSSELTAAGAVMGTPAYMASEQHLGGVSSAATDQFAFCVSLYLALYGSRPFLGEGQRALSEAVCRGRIEAAPEGSRVPQWLRRVVLRGLSPDPDERWPSMNALLEALADDPVRRRRRVLVVGAGVAGVLGLGAAAYATGATRGEQPCQDVGGPVREAFNEERAAAIGRAFATTELSFAVDTAARTNAALQRYADAWLTEAETACRETNIEHAVSQSMLDRRRVCLEYRVARLDSIVTVLEEADEGLVEKAVAMAHGLPSVEGCGDLDRLARGVEPPTSEVQRQRVDAVERDLMRVQALMSAGRFREAIDMIEAVRLRAEDVGYLPTLAKAHHMQGMTEDYRGGDGVAKHTHRAFALALEAGDLEVASRAAADLAHEVGYVDGDPELGAHWLEVAEGLGRRLGGDPQLDVALLNTRALLAIRRADWDEAQTTFESLLETVRDQGEESPHLATALMNLGSFHGERRNLAESREYLEKAQRVVDETLGPRHPKMHQLYSTLGQVSLLGGEYERAQRELTSALQLERDALGSDHIAVGRTSAALAIAYHHLGDLDEAERLHRDGLKIRIAQLGHEHQETAESLRNLSIIVREQGRAEEGIELAREALDIAERKLPDHHPDRAHSRSELGRHLVAQKRWAEAEPLLRTAAARFEEDQTRIFALVEALIALGECERGLGRLDEARQTLERALRLLETIERYHGLQAWARVALAETLLDLGKRGERVTSLLVEGRDEVPEQGPYRVMAERIDAAFERAQGQPTRSVATTTSSTQRSSGSGPEPGK